MVFSSSVFLFFFLPCTVLLYYLSRNRVWRNGVLLLLSLLFYSWGDPRVLGLIIAAALVAYAGAFIIDGCRHSRPGLAKSAYIISIVLILGNLFVFKYFNFTVRNIEALTGLNFGFKEIALPIGISFYTFQTLSYVIDLYRGSIKVQKSPFRLLLYICLFPQLIAGPIVRYSTVEAEIQQRHENFEELWQGLCRFIKGLAKKVLLANNAALVCESIYGSGLVQHGTAAYWLAALAYTMQIYFDFSGYSDMAIGLGHMFGFHFLENFNHPYSSLSISEFWRRWHISLSSWFRDYVYIPLGGNRVSTRRWIFNIFVVWLLTGFWHGAEWNFILWGLYYGVLLVCEKLLWGKHLEKCPSFIRWAYTFVLVMLGWVLFYNTDPSTLKLAIVKMFNFSPTVWFGSDFDLSLLIGIPATFLGLFFIFPPGKRLAALCQSCPEWIKIFCILALLGLSLVFIISSSFNPFIYFRF